MEIKQSRITQNGKFNNQDGSVPKRTVHDRGKLKAYLVMSL